MMRYRSRPFGKALLAALGLFPLAVSPMGVIPLGMMAWGLSEFDVVVSAYAQSRDPIVTSDTPEYCGVLMDRITGITRATAAPPPTEAAMLSEEGERMCVHGQTRGGIMRLRRALEIMRRGEN
jgi:hypothetical protein